MKPYLEVTNSETAGKSITKLSDLGVSDSITGPSNVFKAWLKDRADKLIGAKEMAAARYLKKLLK